MSPTLSEQLTARVRALLRRAEHPATAAGSPARWRAERDRWLDRLDPRHAPEFTASEIRELIDFLAESGPSATSRATKTEFRRDVDDLTPELLFSAH